MITDQQREELKSGINALADAQGEFRRVFARMLEFGKEEDMLAASFAANKCREMRRELFEWIDKEL